MTPYDWAILILTAVALPCLVAAVPRGPARGPLIALVAVCVAAAVALATVQAVRKPTAVTQVSNPIITESDILNGSWAGIFTFHGTEFNLRMNIKSEGDGNLSAKISMSSESGLIRFSPRTAALTGYCTATSVTMTFSRWVGPGGIGKDVLLHGTPPPSDNDAFTGTMTFWYLHGSFAVHHL